MATKSNAASSFFGAINTVFSNMEADLTVRHNKKMIHSITALREEGIKTHTESAKRITTIIEDTQSWLNEGDEKRKEVFKKEYDILEELIKDYIPTPKIKEAE